VTGRWRSPGGRARVVHQPLRGYGNAYRRVSPKPGPDRRDGDSDDSYDFTQIPALIAPLQPVPTMFWLTFPARSSRRHDMEHRHIGNPILTGMLNLLFGSSQVTLTAPARFPARGPQQ